MKTLTCTMCFALIEEGKYSDHLEWHVDLVERLRELELV